MSTVVIFFGGAKYVIDYDYDNGVKINRYLPFVVGVHSYLYNENIYAET
jgi:hypothetical protein